MVNRVRVYEEQQPGGALITTLGIISGEILTDLEQHGVTTMRRLIRELEWPAPMVMMAIGALVREGLIRVLQHDLEVLVQLRREWTIPAVAMGRIADGYDAERPTV